jgi:Domain of unknown function (DUF1707)
VTEDGVEKPSAAMAMRASDADRERVAEVLRDAYAEGRLSPSEHDERLLAAYAATTVGALVPVLADLPVPPGLLPVPHGGVGPVGRSSGHGSISVRPDLAADGDGDAVAVFGAFERRGR